MWLQFKECVAFAVQAQDNISSCVFTTYKFWAVMSRFSLTFGNIRNTNF